VHRTSILSLTLSLTLFLSLIAVWPSAGETPSPSPLKSLVEAERSFSRTAQEKGIRTAFLDFLGEGSVVFRPGPVDGREHSQNMPETGDSLTWAPILAEIAASGDFGYTTGPWTYRVAAGDRPPGHGQYFSIWKKNPAGQWKVAVDIGTFNPAPTAPDLDWSAAKPVPGKWQPEPEEQPDAGAALAAVRAREEAFSAALGQEGIPAAYELFLTDDAVLLRNGQQPAVRKGPGDKGPGGEDPVRETLAAQSGTLAWRTQGSGVAASADLAYTFGSYGSGDEEQGHYLRVWRRLPEGAWKVAVDLLLPLPPPPPPKPAPEPPASGAGADR